MYTAGLEVYLIKQECLHELLLDRDYLEQQKEIFKEFVRNLIQEIDSIKSYRLCLGVVSHKQIGLIPILCMKIGDLYYPVKYHPGWICIECMSSNGAVLMPLIEGDNSCYIGTNIYHVPIPDIFKNQFCKCCGRMLQGHLLFIDE